MHFYKYFDFSEIKHLNVRIFDLPYLIKSSVLFTQWMMSIHLKANYTFPPLFRIILCLSFHRAVGPFASQLALNMHSKQILNTIFHLIVVAILPKRHQKPFRRLREHHRATPTRYPMTINQEWLPNTSEGSRLLLVFLVRIQFIWLTTITEWLLVTLKGESIDGKSLSD